MQVWQRRNKTLLWMPPESGSAHGSIRGYLASFPDAGAAAADMRRQFKFLGDTGTWQLLTSASRDIG